MRTPPRILVADDNANNRDILEARLAAQGYEIVTAADGAEAIDVAKGTTPDLILLDINMPKVDGFEVCRRLKADRDLPFTPIIMVTARTDSKDVIAGLDAGGDEYLTKPVDHAALVARIKSMLRIKTLHDTVQEQAKQLQAQAAQLVEWNRSLEERVSQQVAELDRIGRLRRFLSPQVAGLITSEAEERILEFHRREITVVFCDLRGFTGFAETAEPEDVMAILREYHGAMGALIFQFEGTLERFTGDGLMVFFNDPLPCEDAPVRAVRMAAAMRGQARELSRTWRKRGHDLGFGVGIAVGYASLGKIGFEGRFDYGAIGSVTNLAARLCGDAGADQILISQRVYAMVEDIVEVEHLGDLTLKGFHKPVPAYNVVEVKPAGT